MSPKMIFGTVIALILLGLYSYLVWTAIAIVGCAPQPACLKDFNDQMGSSMALIGGLVSALVIAELAITKPGDTPMARTLGTQVSARAETYVRWTTIAYLGIWVVTGLSAFVVAFRHPSVLQQLTDIGQAWFGLAIAATYSYFGIQPQG